jgi:hypothetical protein
MSSRVTKRPMSEQEREFVTRTLKSAATGDTRWIRGSENALLLWAMSMLLFVFAWKLIAWLAGAALHVEIGWSSPAAVWITGFGALACALVAVVSSVRWIKTWRDARPDLRADLEGGQVIEESYEFTAAKRFQEPEHGGLIYFLRTADDKVFVLYDHESQDLGGQDENPLKSKFQPCTELLIVRAPKTGFVISKQFSGAALDVGDPHELSVAPQSWPESESYCKFRWDELERRLSGNAKRT